MSSLGYTRSTDEIYAIFRRHTDSLLNQERKTYQAIDDWSTGLIKQIRDHVSEQKHLLNQAYDDQKKYLDDMREHFLASFIYGKKDDTKEIDRLLEKCRNLYVELASLDFYSHNTDFIRIIPVKPLELITQEEPNPNKIRGDQFDNRSIHRNESKPVYNREFGSNSSSVSDRTNPPSTSAYDRLPRTNDNNNPNTNIIRDGDSNEKCPICFMIFPSFTSGLTRSMHVDEHYKND